MLKGFPGFGASRFRVTGFRFEASECVGFNASKICP